VCPVGALTSSHFRFKARVWTLKEHASVCPGCATGCTMWLDVDPREQRAYRNRPRDNPAVNNYWMCDDGMMTYTRAHEDRVTEARVGRGAGESVGVEAAVAKAGAVVKAAGKKLAVVLSAQASTEDNLVAAELARQTGASLYLAARAPWEGDKILRHTDANPNRAGATAVALGARLGTVGELLTAASEGAVSAVLFLGVDVDVEPAALSALGRVADVVVVTPTAGVVSKQATVLLPAASWAESDGSFVNAKGMAQAYKRALALPGEAQPGWQLVAAVGRAAGLDLAYHKLREVRAALAAKAPSASPDTVPAAATTATSAPTNPAPVSQA